MLRSSVDREQAHHSVLGWRRPSTDCRIVHSKMQTMSADSQVIFRRASEESPTAVGKITNQHPTGI